MRKLWAKIVGLVVMAILLLPEWLAAAGPAAAPVVIVADTRDMTGWEKWFANLYNDSHISFAILTYVCIGVVGVSLAFLADVVMGRIGIDLTQRDLKEH